MVPSAYAEVVEGTWKELRVRAYIEDGALFGRLQRHSGTDIEVGYWLPVRQEVASGNRYATLHCRHGGVPFDLAFQFESNDEFGRQQADALLTGASAPVIVLEMLLDADATGYYRAHLDLSVRNPYDTDRVAAAIAAAD